VSEDLCPRVFTAICAIDRRFLGREGNSISRARDRDACGNLSIYRTRDACGNLSNRADSKIKKGDSRSVTRSKHQSFRIFQNLLNNLHNITISFMIIHNSQIRIIWTVCFLLFYLRIEDYTSKKSTPVVSKH